MRWVAALVFSAFVLLHPMGGSAAFAEEDTAAARRAVELAWLQGRVEEPAALAQEGWWPISLRDLWWRGSASIRPPVFSHPQDAESLRRRDWLLAKSARGPYPAFPAFEGEGEDPYPILTALIRDRQRRETRGHVGLPEESPLVLLAPLYDAKTDEGLHYYLGQNTRYWMNLAYKGYAEDEYSRRLEREAAALESRNGAWALWSIVLFILIPVLGSLWLGRKRA